MINVSRERNFLKRFGLIAVFHSIHWRFEFDIVWIRSQQVRGDLSTLLYDLIRSIYKRRPSDGERPRAISTQPKIELPGVAMNNVHIINGDAQFVSHQLRKSGLVTLSMAV